MNFFSLSLFLEGLSFSSICECDSSVAGTSKLTTSRCAFDTAYKAKCINKENNNKSM